MGREGWYGLGPEWTKDLKTLKASKDKRDDFYGDKTIRKIAARLLPGEDVSDLTPNDILEKLKEQEKISKTEKIKEAARYETVAGNGQVLSSVLRDFFATNCGSDTPEADTFGALKYLNDGVDNVDILREGETITIEKGLLKIFSGGTLITQGWIIPKDSLEDPNVSAISRRKTIREESAGGRRKLRKEVEEEEGEAAPEEDREEAAPEEAAEEEPPSSPAPAKGASSKVGGRKKVDRKAVRGRASVKR